MDSTESSLQALEAIPEIKIKKELTIFMRPQSATLILRHPLFSRK